MAEPAQRLLPFTVRPMAQDEQPFVGSTWVRHYLSSPATRRIPQELYHLGQTRLVGRLLERATVLVAEESTRGVLLGWIAAEVDDIGPVLHYVYVKGDYRLPGLDVGRALLVGAMAKCGVQLQWRDVRHVAKQRNQRAYAAGNSEAFYSANTLSCGHIVTTGKPLAGTAVCGRCTGARIRYTHEKAPASLWAASMGWQYDPYPAYF